ncbi:MAG: LTA synthase family protein [Cyclobacteriaceae bacterium]
MKKTTNKVLLFFYYYGFWLAFFVAGKILFTLYNLKETSELNIPTYLRALLYGLKLDSSMAGYLSAIPILIFFFTSFFTTKVHYYLIKYYTLLCIVLCGLTTVIDMKLYTYWGLKLDQDALSYLENPSLVFSSTGVLDILLPTLLFIAYVSLSFFLFNKYIAQKILACKFRNFYASIWYLVITSLLFIPIRGGFDISPKIQLGIPIKAGAVFFHKNIYANHTALNVQWYLLESIMYKKENNAKYLFFKNGEEQTIYSNQIKENGDTTTTLLNTNRPNIILLILESFTANIIESLGGHKDVTPNINRYVKEGVLFDRFYASGTNSAKGIAAIFSAKPAMPNISLLSYTTKIQKLPHLMKEVGKLGYDPAFFYGGDMNFKNFKVYFSSGGAKRIISKDDFPLSDHKSKWGAPDHIMLEKMSKEIETMKRPFFASAFTLSSHDPFDVPMETMVEGSDADHRFMNAAYYTDKSIGEFIERTKKQDWWDSTLVIIVADHGTKYASPGPRYIAKNFKIPMLWLGGALAIRDTIIHTVGSQYDIPKTLLSQLGHKAPQFGFSNNLLSNDAKNTAFYGLGGGFGWVTDSSVSVYSLDSKKYYLKTDSSRQDIPEAKAFMQVLAKDFSDL